MAPGEVLQNNEWKTVSDGELSRKTVTEEVDAVRVYPKSPMGSVLEDIDGVELITRSRRTLLLSQETDIYQTTSQCPKNRMDATIGDGLSELHVVIEKTLLECLDIDMWLGGAI